MRELRVNAGQSCEINLVAVLPDSGKNIESQSECAPSIFERNHWRAAFPHSAQK